MRKKISAVTFAVIALMGIAGIYSRQSFKTNQDTENDLLLENAAALARIESDGSSNYWTCWSQSMDSDGGFWRCGNPCVWVDGQKGVDEKGRCYK